MELRGLRQPGVYDSDAASLESGLDCGDEMMTVQSERCWVLYYAFSVVFLNQPRFRLVNPLVQKFYQWFYQLQWLP